jgi:hypothetical protein
VSDQMLRVIVGGVLLLHGVSHVGAIAALAWIARFGPGHTGGWHAARSWLVPDLPASTATAVACVMWALALVGFVAAALSFWGIGLPIAAWRGLALVSAVVSAAGIASFFGTWPAFNTLAALGVNLAVIAVVLLQWSPPWMLG